MSYHVPWTEDQTAALRKHIKDGWLSYSGIANALNEEFNTHYSRNAAIGKAARLGLDNPYYRDHILSAPKAPRKPQVYKPRPKRPQNFIPVENVQLLCSEIVSRNLNIVDLEEADCRYPTNDAAPYVFCGHPQLVYFKDGNEITSSYCMEHFSLSLRRNG